MKPKSGGGGMVWQATNAKALAGVRVKAGVSGIAPASHRPKLQAKRRVRARRTGVTIVRAINWRARARMGVTMRGAKRAGLTIRIGRAMGSAETNDQMVSVRAVPMCAATRANAKLPPIHPLPRSKI